MYTWSTESDQIIRRAVNQGTQVYMFPLEITQKSAQELFLALANQTQKLNLSPRFYNSAISNCTNELAKVTNTAKPGTIPLDIAWIMPGYSVELLYRLKFINNTLPLSEIRSKYNVSNFVKANYKNPNFSNILRSYLLKS